jgi:hypothetical protein
MSTRTGLRTRIDADDEFDDRREFETSADDGPGLSRYDLFLALLPLPLLVGLGWGAATPAPLSAGAGLGSLPSAALLAYGLFVDGPSVPRDDDGAT